MLAVLVGPAAALPPLVGAEAAVADPSAAEIAAPAEFAAFAADEALGEPPPQAVIDTAAAAVATKRENRIEVGEATVRRFLS
ncbi:MAG: hypothetical protein ABI429_00485 [Jatrophihabitantaceae bacterium]